jgi:hypothetical protein
MASGSEVVLAGPTRSAGTVRPAGPTRSADAVDAVELSPSLSAPGADELAGHPGTGFRLRPAPSREPPFDDEPVARQLSLVGARDQQLPLTVPQTAQARLRLTRTTPFEQQTVPDDLPDPAGFARRFAIAVIEAATGRRTPGQLSQHTSAGVLAGLVRDAGRINRLGTATRPASLHSLHLAEPADGVIEAAAIVRVGTRYRAIAFRLEGLNGRWRCVRLQIG